MEIMIGGRISVPKVATGLSITVGFLQHRRLVVQWHYRPLIIVAMVIIHRHHEPQTMIIDETTTAIEMTIETSITDDALVVLAVSVVHDGEVPHRLQPETVHGGHILWQQPQANMVHHDRREATVGDGRGHPPENEIIIVVVQAELVNDPRVVVGQVRLVFQAQLMDPDVINKPL